MSDPLFAELDELQQSRGAAAAIERLIAALTERGEYDQLFDALMLKTRLEMGLPLLQPTALDDVPEDRLEAFETAYVDAAREVGRRYLEAGRVPQAWVYLQHIREPEPVREALEVIDPRQDPGEAADELINVALYEGAHPVKGLEIMLAVHGMCNTITAMEQQIHKLGEDDRRAAAALLVRELYDDLCATVRSEVEQRLAGVPAGDTLRELIANRDWLFEEGNYHVDVSHLNAVVRFARFLTPDDPELRQAIELCEYGAKLAPQFQYPADPPFDDFYPAHRHYFRVLAGEAVDEGLDFFRRQIEEEPDEEDRPMIAYVLVDLLIRIGRLPEAVEAARDYLSDVEDPENFSFSRLCREAGRLETLRETARAQNDVVSYVAATIETASKKPGFSTTNFT